MTPPVLENLSTPPQAAKHHLYRWCDYIELRCLTHIDGQFSRDNFKETVEENADTNTDTMPDEDEWPEGRVAGAATDDVGIAATDDRLDLQAADYFKLLKWRKHAFAESWPFEIHQDANEIRLKPEMTDEQRFYITLLLCSSLAYIPAKRRQTLTQLLEKVSLEVMKHLMPKGAEVHSFAARGSNRYTGNLYSKLQQLTKDVRGTCSLKQANFSPTNTGDSGLDIVAWHGLADDRPGIPIAFAQCGCTADGWANKMLEASPARLATQLNTTPPWATYYFMPLDLSIQTDETMDWQRKSDLSAVIVIDRLRFVRLTACYKTKLDSIFTTDYINEALALKLS